MAKVMETVRLDIKDDFLLRSTRENNTDIRWPINHIHFVICNSCFWCASYFSIDNMDTSSQVLRCRLCNSHNTELIPITSNESFRIDYHDTQGMQMEFYRSNEIVDRQQESHELQTLPLI